MKYGGSILLSKPAYQSYLDNIPGFMPIVKKYEDGILCTRVIRLREDMMSSDVLWLVSDLMVSLTQIAISSDIGGFENRVVLTNRHVRLTFIAYKKANHDKLLLGVKRTNNKGMSVGLELNAIAFDEDLRAVVYDVKRMR